jgi:hypothetical protein
MPWARVFSCIEADFGEGGLDLVSATVMGGLRILRRRSSFKSWGSMQVYSSASPPPPCWWALPRGCQRDWAAPKGQSSPSVRINEGPRLRGFSGIETMHDPVARTIWRTLLTAYGPPLPLPHDLE